MALGRPPRTRKTMPLSCDDAKKEIRNALYYDRLKVVAARAQVRGDSNWPNWDSQKRERRLQIAALAALQQRLEKGQHVGCKFPVFKNYIPICVYGRTGMDAEKELLIEEQLGILADEKTLRPSCGFGDDDDDDEEDLVHWLGPKMKKPEGEDTRKLSEIEPYAAGQKSELSELEDDDDNSAEDEASTKNNYHEDEGDDKDEDEAEEANQPSTIAIVRGAPLLDLTTLATKPLARKVLVDQKLHLRTAKPYPQKEKAAIRGQTEEFEYGNVIWSWAAKEKAWVSRKRPRVDDDADVNVEVGD